MTVRELAAKYYPRLWPKARLEALVTAGHLTREQVEEIIGKQEDNSKMVKITGGGGVLTPRRIDTP